MEEVREKISKDAIFILPVGISEGHGRHLPVGTDTIQAEHICDRVADEMEREAVVGPVLKYGNCRATKHLPGTLSISFDSLRNITYDILESAVQQGFEKMIMISGHAGNSHMTALKLAAEDIVEEKDADIVVLSDYYFAYDFKGEDVPETDGHGGEIETSKMLDIVPELVDDDRPHEEISYPKYLVVKDYGEYLTEGMRGDAGNATKEDGKRIHDYVVEKIIETVQSELMRENE